MKRFTATEKWADPWYRKLPPEQKLAWAYLCENCDAAGVIDLDRELADFAIGAAVDWDAFLRAAGDRCEVITKGKIWLTGFINFQYGRLSEDCKAHSPVFASLAKHHITERLSKGFANPMERDKDKDKDKEKDKDSVLEGGCKGETIAPVAAITPFDAFWEATPRKVGKLSAKSAYTATIRTLKERGQDDPHGFLLDRIKAFAASPKGRGEFCPHPTTWLNQGRYDDDPTTWLDSGENRNGRRNAIGAGQRHDSATATRPPEIGWSG
jgi:hypothetical protein